MIESTDWKESGRAPMSRKRVTCAEARELLEYEPETGILRWKRNMSTRARAGSQAGVVQERRYRRIGIRGTYYMAPRLAWLIMTGDWPADQIDHINGKQDDNRWANLREANSSQNKWNTIKKNRSGLVGAAYHSGKNQYRATIRKYGITKFLGWFDDPVDAHKAYVAASKLLHGEFSPCK